MHCRGFEWVELYFTPLYALDRGDLTFYPACCYVYEPVLACCWDELLILSVRRLISVCSYAHGDGTEVDSRWRWVAGFAAVRPEKVPCYPLNRRLLGRELVSTLKKRSCHITESRASVVFGRPVRCLVTIPPELSRVLGLALSTQLS